MRIEQDKASSCRKTKIRTLRGREREKEEQISYTVGAYCQRHKNKIAYWNLIHTTNFCRKNKPVPKRFLWELVKILPLAWHKDSRDRYWKGKAISKIKPLSYDEGALVIQVHLQARQKEEEGEGQHRCLFANIDHIWSGCHGMWEIPRTSCTHTMGYCVLCFLSTMTWSDSRAGSNFFCVSALVLGVLILLLPLYQTLEVRKSNASPSLYVNSVIK